MPEASVKAIERAQLSQREHRLEDARHDWLAAIDLLRRDDAREPLATALRALGEVERKLCDADGARVHYEESVAILRDFPDHLKLAHTVRHLGDVHHDSGRADLAVPCYDEALELYRAHPNPPPLDLANAIRSMAVLKQESGDRQRIIKGRPLG